MKVRVLLSIAAAAMLVACGSSPTGSGSCSTSTDCEDGLLCVSGRCVAPTDAGQRDAGTMPPDDCEDRDRDGVTDIACGGNDCDDSNPRISPDETEQCGDGQDNDCDGDTDESSCDCTVGQRITCYTGAPATRRVGQCRNGIAICTGPGEVGECEGEVLPADAESCNDIDDDCDGMVDEGVRNACGECSDTTPMELCGNGLDDDCDGMVDEDCDCDYRCLCPDMTSCNCRPPTNQPCYEGPFGTEGVGSCTGGRRDCVDAGDDTYRWAACTGEVLPSEECAGDDANGVDDDCDGRIDEGCADGDDDGVPWPTDCDDTDDAIFPGASERCNGRDDNCDGIADEGVTNACGTCDAASSDECGNGLDDDCNGVIDDGCDCESGGTQECYPGPAGTAGVGQCRAGTQTCDGTEFLAWGECEGAVGPSPELCNGMDDDCDGETDERWAVGSNACGFCNPTEVCDGEDQDCDGIVDEGVANACGDCGPEPTETCNGMDDDCDGQSDEGLVNACGTCPPEPCFDDGFEMPGDCEVAGRDCEGIEEHPDHPGSATLAQNSFDNDFIYLAVTQRNQVAKINTTTGAREWQVASHGNTPSRTAVAVDGSVWVGNRGLSGNANNPAVSNVVHLRESDGALICRAPVVGIARGLAIDGDGNIWAGAHSARTVYHISGTEVDNTTSPPTCRVLRMLNVGQAVYGLAADPDGFIWTSSTPAVRIDPATYATRNFTHAGNYGVAADGAGNVWFGNLSGTVHAIRRADGSILNTSITGVSGITIHPDGFVWGSRYSNNAIVKINPTTGALVCSAPTTNGTNPHGVAVDSMGRIWSPNRNGGYVNVYDQNDCRLLHSYVVDAGQELYSYSDMTGHLLRTFISPEGWWRQNFDSGYEDTYPTSVEWDSLLPADTGIEVFVRAADTEAGLEMATPCGPFTTSPGDLTTCAPALGNHRYVRVEARLFRTGGDNRPVFHRARVHWAY